MAKKSRRVPEAKAATEEEVVAAIEGLSEPALVRLEKFARLRIAGLGRASCGRDHEDLLSEAVTRTLAGNRRWNRDVTFVQHMLGVIRSISSHWREQFDQDDEPWLEADLTSGDDSAAMATPLQRASAPGPVIDDELVTKQALDQIQQMFSGDKVISDIIDGLDAELSGPEIQTVLGLTEKEYRTKMRQIRRKTKPIKQTLRSK